MSYSSYALPGKCPLEFRIASVAPAVRLAGTGLRWLGGSVIFAATVYLVLALPGLMD